MKNTESKNKDMNCLKATLWIGKKGCTESTIEEIRRQVEGRKTIKVKWLRNTDIKPEDIAEKSGTKLIQTRGRTMLLGRKQN
ncbi:RNA-binding protein [Methanomicrobium sp. W14]|uniref:YhbY family RNA-binding protein n=1 Tax=Methanomicrobium sp. W14 TaxID=2817839 RepID=UPI001FD91E63|nr:YhbY family RNA-binding protein [Methanomicrobium sp. W14]MBP2132857.1 RNA-binding protein [Methanomicrobium sp. W14]